MCGRFLLDADCEVLIERYDIFVGIETALEGMESLCDKRDEVFPGTEILIINSLKQAIWLTWGLKGLYGRTLINVRVETFFKSQEYQRLEPCLVPATGYYEWERRHKGKCKIESANGMMTFAGLWNPETQTVCILTMPASDELAWVHDRMPVILEPNDFESWFDGLRRKVLLNEIIKRKTPDLSVENLEPTMQLSLFD